MSIRHTSFLSALLRHLCPLLPLGSGSAVAADSGATNAPAQPDPVWICAAFGVILLLAAMEAARRYRARARALHRELEAQRVMLNGLLSAAPDGMLLIQPDGTILLGNVARCRRTEALPLAGTSMYALMPPEAAARRRTKVEQVLRSGEALRYQDTLGSCIVDTHICPVRDAAGAIIHLAVFCVDSTEQHAVEQQLRESEEKFWAIANYTVDGETWFGPDGTCRWMNPGVAKLTGYAPDRFEQSPEFLFEIVHPDDRNTARRFFVEALHGSSGENLELRCIRHDGVQVWLSLSWQPMFNHGGTFLGTRISARDFTAIKAIEEQLSLQSLVLDQIHDAVTVTDLNGIIIYVNQAGIITFQRSLDDLIGTPITLFGQTSADMQQEILRQTLDQGEWQGKLLRRDENGHDRVLACRTTLVRDRHWAPIGMCSIAADVTEQERTQQALGESEARFRGVFETSPTGIVLAEARTLRLLRANASFLAIIGYSDEELPGLTVAAITHPEDWEAERPLVEANHSTIGRQFEFEKRFVRKDGSVRWVHVRGAYLPPEMDTRLVIGTVADITARKEAESALRASLAEKEVLLREVHHRVKNNLAAIIGLLDIQGHAQTDPLLRTALTELGNRIRSMSLVHENLYQSASVADINFPAYTRNLIDHLHASYGSASVRSEIDMQDVTLSLDHALPCGMILNELITNAFKYAFPLPLSGEACIRVALRQDGDCYVLSVCDNGVGLPPDFDWRTAQSLGMVLVRTLGQHQLGGVLSMQGEHGTCCTLTFHRKRRSNTHEHGNHPAG